MSQYRVKTLPLSSITVRVRRQNSQVKTVPLGNEGIISNCNVHSLLNIDQEFKRFFADNFPSWRRGMISTGYSYDLRKLQATEGLPEAARDLLQSQEERLDRLSPQQREELIKIRSWTSQSYGMLAEYKVTKGSHQEIQNEWKNPFHTLIPP